MSEHTLLSKKANRLCMESQDVIENHVEHLLHVRALSEEPLILLKQRYAFTNSLIRIEQFVEGICPSTRHLGKM